MHRWSMILALGAALLLAACSRGTPAQSASISRADAIRLVLSADPRFSAIEARDPGLVGQASWYQLTPTTGGWQIEVLIGWGDCPAGCISEHLWTYTVGRDGTLALVHEVGDPLAGGGISGIVTSGPVCPVERASPDPACADRPVVGATLIILGSGGGEVARVTTDGAGRFSVDLAPGSYAVEPQPVTGLLGTPPSQDVTVTGSDPGPVLSFAYDTGIR